MASTSMTARTGVPSMLGSRSAMRLAPRMAETSGSRHRTGTGKNMPPVVFMVSATLTASATFMKPGSGLK